MLSLHKNNRKKYNFLKYLSLAEIINIVAYFNESAFKDVCELKDVPDFDNINLKEINCKRRENIKNRLWSAAKKKTRQISKNTAKNFILIKTEMVIKYKKYRGK